MAHAAQPEREVIEGIQSKWQKRAGFLQSKASRSTGESIWGSCIAPSFVLVPMRIGDGVGPSWRTLFPNPLLILFPLHFHSEVEKFTLSSLYWFDLSFFFVFFFFLPIPFLTISTWNTKWQVPPSNFEKEKQSETKKMRGKVKNNNNLPINFCPPHARTHHLSPTFLCPP